MFVFATYGNFQAETNMWRRLTRFEGADLARSMSQMLALAVRFLPSCSEGRTEIHTQTVRSTLNVKTSMSRCATEVDAIPEYAGDVYNSSDGSGLSSTQQMVRASHRSRQHLPASSGTRPINRGQ